MSKVNFNKLGLKLQTYEKEWQFSDTVILTVKTYLPIVEKSDLIMFVVNNAADDNGCFSPVRTEVYFSLGLAKWYAGINFTDKQINEGSKTYDILESNEFFSDLRAHIGEEEYDCIESLLEETLNDISRFNNSFVGMMNAVSGDADNLSAQASDIMTKLQNKEGLETLSLIKDTVQNG